MPIKAITCYQTTSQKVFTTVEEAEACEHTEAVIDAIRGHVEHLQRPEPEDIVECLKQAGFRLEPIPK